MSDDISLQAKKVLIHDIILSNFLDFHLKLII